METAKYKTTKLLKKALLKVVEWFMDVEIASRNSHVH